MSIPFSLVWTNSSDAVISEAGFPVAFPGTASIAHQLQLASNAFQLQTFETLTGVGFFITGDEADVNIVQNVWPVLGGTTKPQLNGGLDISFDRGQTYTRFDSTHGVQRDSSTWISLPITSVGSQGIAATLGPFDTSHFIVRYIIPPGAVNYGVLNISLGIGFDVI